MLSNLSAGSSQAGHIPKQSRLLEVLTNVLKTERAPSRVVCERAWVDTPPLGAGLASRAMVWVSIRAAPGVETHGV